jgi:transposase-like protein
MSKTTTGEAEVLRLRQSLETQMRRRILEAIELVLEEELTEALGTVRYGRREARRGYRNGHATRRITTAQGLHTLAVPRGRIVDPDGSSREFRSQALPRYARRTREVDEAILGAYLAGANTRRIRKALAPLLGEEHLSKSAVSRVASRLKDLFRCWSERDVSAERYAILFLDGFHLKVRMARRVVSVPVLAVLGVAEDGRKHLVALHLAASEASSHWASLIADLQGRGLEAPALILSDGHAGLRKAIALWPEAQVQRCTWHKWQNLVEHCPVHARRELKRDYDAIVRAEDGLEARKAYRAFLVKWTSLCPAVARSLEEAGEQLLTFYTFPKAMWRALRTTNALENLNREFRRRTKTQASFSTEEAGVTLLYGLVAFGQIQLRKIDGHRHVSELLAPCVATAA